MIDEVQRYSRMRDVDRLANEFGMPVDFIAEFVEILISKGYTYKSAVERVDEALTQARFNLMEANNDQQTPD